MIVRNNIVPDIRKLMVVIVMKQMCLKLLNQTKQQAEYLL